MKPTITIRLQFQHFSYSVYLTEAAFCVPSGATHKEQKANKSVHPLPHFHLSSAKCTELYHASMLCGRNARAAVL